MKQEVKMRLREKIGILALALFLSFAAFSMIAADSPLVHSIIRKG
jgi:hypothetical protein